MDVEDFMSVCPARTELKLTIRTLGANPKPFLGTIWPSNVKSKAIKNPLSADGTTIFSVNFAK